MPRPGAGSDADWLEQLRFLRRVQAADLARTDRWIASIEARLARTRPGAGEGQSGPGGRSSTPPPPSGFVLAYPVAGPALHTSECWIPLAGSDRLTAAQARQAVADGAEVCDVCQPDPAAGTASG
ncbi:DUF6233 domain-containing protein [Streptomyces yaizuensis]|uniref:DUF6233 domain-containing protein n=1 Tax=Streptomyces yaizuensis TaxID=2989713 RepID=A0AA86J2Z4_9ACTN|nr:DUF6233 domain-containing protein [Streptomyces sp. YSPA8]BDT39482.1 DUF6233 domain-containing protein [Streptomyces sp. YSPA8]